MESVQPWNGYRQPPFGYGEAGTSTYPDMKQSIEWLSRLSREEKHEEKRKQIEAGFSFDGYEIVRRGIAGGSIYPEITIRDRSFTFNSACIRMLEAAAYIHIAINADIKKIAIRSVSEGTKDALRWCIVSGDKRKSRRMTCPDLAKMVYEFMEWELEYYYKTDGFMIRFDGEDVFVFDLQDSRKVVPQRRNPETGEIIKSEIIRPQGWGNSFGVGVKEHAESMNIDLRKGFKLAGEDGGNPFQGGGL